MKTKRYLEDLYLEFVRSYGMPKEHIQEVFEEARKSTENDLFAHDLALKRLRTEVRKRKLD